MMTLVSSASAPPILDQGTRLSLTRTRLAAERTLMSWIRTSFSMISFGFTMGKFLQYLSKQPSMAHSTDTRTIPVLLIVLGLASLLVGVLEFRHELTELAAASGIRHRPTALGIIAALVGLLGVLAFAGLFVRLDLF